MSAKPPLPGAPAPEASTPFAYLLRLAESDPRDDTEIMALVRARLGLEDKAKAALLIARMINPLADLTEAEEASVRGLSEKTLRRHKSEGLLPSSPQAGVLKVQK